MASAGVLQERMSAAIEENKVQGSPADRKTAEMAEVSILLKETEELSEQRDEQAKQHKDVRDLIWRKGLELKVELEKLKRLKEATQKEIQDAEKKHRVDCVWARKEILGLEQQVKRYHDAIASFQKKKDEQQQQQIEEARLATDKIASLKATLQGLKKKMLEMEAERQHHLASCKASRKEVLQLEGEIEELKKDIEEKSLEGPENGDKQATELQAMQADIERLQLEKEELLKQKASLNAAGGGHKQLDEASKLARNAKVQLYHEVVELKRAMAEQQASKERENQRHLRRCKVTRREVLKLQQELQELKSRKQEGQKAMEELAKEHAVVEELSKAEVSKLRDEVDGVKAEQRDKPAGMVKNDSQGSLSSRDGIYSSLEKGASMSPFSPVGGDMSSFDRQGSIAFDALEDLLAEEEFQKVLSQQQMSTPPALKRSQGDAPASQGVVGTPSQSEEQQPAGDEQDPLMGVAVASTSMLCSPPEPRSG